MKRLLFVLLVSGMASCGNMGPGEEGMPESAGKPGGTSFRIEIAGAEKDFGTRSILAEGIETKVTDVTFAAYDGSGILSDVKYFGTDLSSLSLDLIPKLSYNVYALANMGDMTEEFPVYEKDVSVMDYELASYENVGEAGIPMCGTVNVTAGGTDCVVRLERLFAKVCVRLLHGRLYDADPDSPLAMNMCNKSIYVRQANRKLLPFSDSASRALGSSDIMDISDYNPDMNDRDAYEGALRKDELAYGPGYFQDTTLVFYVPENVQGRLLPDNSDPFGKVYDKIDGLDGKAYGDLCSYVEFNASRVGNHGYSGSVMYRCYLGADNTSDFSVRRNCRYDLTLDFSEDGFFIDSWKVSRGEDWVDNRCLRFVDDHYTVNPGGTSNVMVHFHKYTAEETHSQLHPERWRYQIDEDAMKKAGLTLSFDPGRLVAGRKYNDFCLSISAAENAEIGASFPMTVMTTDGSIVDHAVISVVEDTELTADWNFCPEYISQYGSFTVGGYDEADLPLSFSVSDGSRISCVRESENMFRVVALDAGQSHVSVTSADGKKTVTAYLNVWTPELVLDKRRVELNPDGETLSVGFGYQTVSGKPLDNIDSDVFASIMMPLVSGAGYFASAVSENTVKCYVRNLYENGSQIVPGSVYTMDITASGCASVRPVTLKIAVTDPFEGMGFRNYGVIDDYTLFGLNSVRAELKEKFADEIRTNSSFDYEGPVPEADPAYVSVELVPRWTGRFCKANGVYSLSRNPASGMMKLRQNAVMESTAHSAGMHDVMISVRNRHSGEKLVRSCGTLEIYVHGAIGAEAVFGSRECGYMVRGNVKTFAEIYNHAAGRRIYQDPSSSLDIHYMDVTMKWMTPVKGVHVFNMMSGPNDSYDGLRFLQPSVSDGQQEYGQLYSVCEIGGDDRISVCGESAGPRAGVGRMLYRSLLMTTYDRELSRVNLHEYFFNYRNGSSAGLFAPAYSVYDEAGFKDGSYYFAPSSCPGNVDGGGYGYHVIHFLDSIYPETSGWINLL